MRIKFYLILLFRKNIIKNYSRLNNVEAIFTNIYDINYWGDKESVSGPGSNLISTKNIRHELSIIIKRYNINNIVDAPCGDFYWMNEIINSNPKINYIGCDIVDKLLIINKKKYQKKNIKFQKLNILSSKLPDSDLLICRDFLIHLSYNDILSFFKLFLNTKIKYILVDSYDNNENNFLNKDIITGDFRKIDLFDKPFNFKKNFIYSFKDNNYLEIKNFKRMYLFTRYSILKNYKFFN